MDEEDVIRVMVVDDHLVVRQGFALFLSAFNDLKMVGEAKNGAEAVQLCAELKPDVVLMDIVMPVMGGLDAIIAIRSAHPEVKIIALTSFSEDNQLVQNALSAGAVGFLFKDISVTDLANAIRLTYAGIPVLSPEATRMLLYSKGKQNNQTFNLSERELEVLALLVRGLSNQEIADTLSVSRSTIKFHVSSILGKLGAGTRTEAVSIALQHKLLP